MATTVSPETVAPPPAEDRAPLGAHVSIAGGTWEAGPRCAEIAATGAQLFTKQANRWAEREVAPEEAARFRAAMAATSVRWLCAHDSYLINLASPDPALRARSLDSFRAELRRCHALGLDALVSHPGNYMDDRASGVARNADAITEALEAEPGPTRLLMELTAGQGTVLGSTFEEMAELLGRLPAPVAARVGVCLDTAHVWAAGYDLVADYDGVMARLADVLGIDRLGCLHLNDSKAKCGSHLDRHELIGEGTLGAEPFRRVMTDARLASIPKVIETPKGDDAAVNDGRMLRLLRSFATGALLAMAAVPLLPGARAAAQEGRQALDAGWHGSVEGGMLLGRTWLPGNGPAVRGQPGVQGSVQVERALGATGRGAHEAPLRGGVTMRVASQALRVTAGGEQWTAGTRREVALLATVGTRALPVGALPMGVALEGHAGVALAGGGGNLLPFRGASALLPMLEGGVVLGARRATGTPAIALGLALRAGAMRLAPSPSEPVSAGWVRHLSVSLRMARGRSPSHSRGVTTRGKDPAATLAAS